MRTRTRGQLLDRLNRYRQVHGQTAASNEVARAYLDDAYRTVWEYLCAGCDGFGLVHFQTVLASDTTTFDLPANFADLHALVLNPGPDSRTPERTTPLQGLQWSRFTNQGERYGYWVEGPGQDWDGVSYVDYNQRLHFVPAVPAGTTLALVYTRQAPTLADADGSYSDVGQDATVVIDTISEGVEGAMIAYARMWQAARDDTKETQRATAALQAAADAFIATRVRRDGFDAVLLADL